jgi:uncharacterized membrane protein
MAWHNLLILFFSGMGFLISLYFTFVFYGLMKPDAAFVPRFCRLDERTCQYLMGTRNARVLGARNFVLGLLYYVSFPVYLSSGGLQSSVPLGIVMFVSMFTVLMSAYLAYGLFVKLKTHCVLCYTSHACNLLIFLGLVAKRLS